MTSAVANEQISEVVLETGGANASQASGRGWSIICEPDFCLPNELFCRSGNCARLLQKRMMSVPLRLFGLFLMGMAGSKAAVESSGYPTTVCMNNCTNATIPACVEVPANHTAVLHFCQYSCEVQEYKGIDSGNIVLLIIGATMIVASCVFNFAIRRETE